jgi:hypothetical protein
MVFIFSLSKWRMGDRICDVKWQQQNRTNCSSLAGPADLKYQTPQVQIHNAFLESLQYRQQYCHMYEWLQTGLDWRLDLLTTLTQNSWLHLITAPSLSPHFTDQDNICYVFSVCCVFTSCSLVTASNSGDSSASMLTLLPAGSQLQQLSSLHRLPYD